MHCGPSGETHSPLAFKNALLLSLFPNSHFKVLIIDESALVILAVDRHGFRSKIRIDRLSRMCEDTRAPLEGQGRRE